jgi:hypothetical protein
LPSQIPLDHPLPILLIGLACDPRPEGSLLHLLSDAFLQLIPPLLLT